MPLRRTPPPSPAPAPIPPSPPTHLECKSESSGPSVSESSTKQDHSTAGSCLTLRNSNLKDLLTKTEFRDILEKLKQEQETSIKTLLKTMQDGIRSHTEQYGEIQKSIDFLSHKYDEIVAKVNTLEAERVSDRKYIQTLEDKLEQIERHSRCSTIEIRNIPTKPNESKADLMELVQKVGNVINIPVQPSEIRDIYRINTKDEKNKPIVADFRSVLLNDKIIEATKKYNKQKTGCKLNTT